MHILFFDIDGTLINTCGSGLTALKIAFTEVFGTPAPEEVATAGRTDRAIARDLFLGGGVEDSAEHWHRFSEAYMRHLTHQLARRDGHVLPGVVALLERLSQRDDVALGLLTGNTPEGARIKLGHFGIDHYFRFGGFGDRHLDRNAVAQAALEAARSAVDHALSLDRVWVVGDTPLDIRCARHIGARAVAVATGMVPKPDLAEAAPDFLLDDLSQAEPWLQWLGQGRSNAS